MDTSKMFKKRDKKEKKKKDKSDKKHHRKEEESDEEHYQEPIAVPEITEEQSDHSEQEVNERDNVKIPPSSSIVVEQEPATSEKKDSKLKPEPNRL